MSGLGAAVAVVIGLSACTSQVGYAAIVNGHSISETSINQQLADLSRNHLYVKLVDQQSRSGPVEGSSPGSYNKAFVARLLDQQVRYEIIHQRLLAAHSVPSPEKVTAAKSTVTQAFPAGVFAAFPARYQNRLATQQADADQFVTLVSADMTPDALKGYYQAHLADYATEACVRHILIADKDRSGNLDYTGSLTDARKVKAQLDAGGDFAALAKQYSQDNQGSTGGSAAVGGALQGSAADGCLTSNDLSQLITEFAKSVLTLPVNQVSDPVKTQFGYHLIEVTKRVVEPLDATVTTDIQRRLAGEALTKLISAASVKVNPAFGSFDKATDPSGQILGVTAPSVPNLGGRTTAAPSAPTTGSGG